MPASIRPAAYARSPGRARGGCGARPAPGRAGRSSTLSLSATVALAASRCARQAGPAQEPPSEIARGHVGKAAQPDEAVGIVEIAERADPVHADRLLRLDQPALEEVDQRLAPARAQRVAAQFDHAVLVAQAPGGVDAAQPHAPVGLPGAAFVGRERLPPVRRVRAEPLPDAARRHRPAGVGEPAREGADAVLVEAARPRRVERAVVVAGPVEAPPPQSRRVPAQRQAEDALAAAGADPFADEVVDVAEAPGQRPALLVGGEHLPAAAAGGAFAQALVADAPTAVEEVEVVAAVARGGGAHAASAPAGGGTGVRRLRAGRPARRRRCLADAGRPHRGRMRGGCCQGAVSTRPAQRRGRAPPRAGRVTLRRAAPAGAAARRPPPRRGARAAPPPRRPGRRTPPR